MKYNEYLEQRQALMNELQTLIDSGASDEEYNAKKAEVEALDEKWEAICQRQADLNALSDNQKTVDVQAIRGVDIKDGKVTAQVSFAPANAMTDDAASLFQSDSYKNAWAKSMMGQQLTADDTGIVIPETVASGIWDMIEEMYPLWADVQKTYVKGNYTMPISNTSTDAAWYDEGTATADGTETFRELALTGCELSRAITRRLYSVHPGETRSEDGSSVRIRRVSRKGQTQRG